MQIGVNGFQLHLVIHGVEVVFFVQQHFEVSDTVLGVQRLDRVTLRWGQFEHQCTDGFVS
ncbi:hypothetical protein D3C87_2046080 [compost metagenome]